ncbi:DUF2169 domain-containing protein [Sorangium sp. So ce1153]|uniref:DUF2169 family type VI secretion system accessory protein n=1 Tax=Sorangium sp. So ce1153 TaxID=3133333 RepID=UPI003F634DA5
MRSSWPVDVVALNPVSCGAVLWRAGGLLRVTVVVKATFALSADGDAALLAPEPIEREDRHHDEDPSRSLRAASETAPYLPGAGVVLTGHAHAPRGAPVAALSARLALFRDVPLLDKTIHVFGDVAPGSDTPGPFQTMPLVYERARGGSSFPWNPVGLSDASDGARADAPRPAVYSGRTRPNLVNPVSPHRPAAFGPIAPHWPLRRRLFGGVEPRATRLSAQPGSPGADPAAAASAESAQVLEIPDDFDFRALDPAPFDQQIPFLQGDEWIVMDNLNAGRARVQTRLPSARARVRRHRVSAAGASGPQEISLSADMLLIDTDRQIASLVWRGNFAIESQDVIRDIRLFAGVETSTVTIPWPDLGDIALSGHARGRAGEAAGPAAGAPRTGAVVHLQEQVTHQNTAPAASLSGRGAASSALGRTGPVKMVEMPVLPFGGAPAAPRAEPDLSVSGGITGPLGQRMPIPEGMLAQVGAERARFPLAAPGTGASRGEPPIPGAPWSPVPAPPLVRPADPRQVQDDLTLDDLTLDDLTLVDHRQQPVRAAVASEPPPEPHLAAAPRQDSRETTLGPRGASSEGPFPQHAAAVPPERVSPAVEAAPGPRAEVIPPERVSLATEAAPRTPVEVVPPERVSRPVEVGSPAAMAPPAPGQALAGLEARKHAEAMLAEGRDLDGEDLSGGDLVGLDFSGRSLARCALRGAKLRGARFTGATLVEAILEEADLRGADLSRAVLTNARADRAELVEAVLEGADLRGAALSGANLQRARLARARGDGATLCATNLEGADLEEARFAGASFVDANLRGTKAERGDFTSARFDRADLGGASFRNARLASAVLAHARLELTDLRGADLERANLHGAARRRAKLAGAKVKDIDEAAPASPEDIRRP